ncbi:RICIN domain-containing protein [Paenibacillus thermoaerophilus]|uniref:RICIN domain-containing protein n=1 Tax=Paenibacillus thermoaerophilus TaxID=1215385 RepID=A0ABW2V3M7_9BACL
MARPYSRRNVRRLRTSLSRRRRRHAAYRHRVRRNLQIDQREQRQTLDVSSSGTADGTNVQIWTDNGTGAQKWNLIRLP